ncbi:MAG: shikimate kinase [Actinomycetota bacterium]
MERHLVVTGLIASGKSTVADAVANRLGWPHLDSDDQLRSLIGRSGAEIVEADGIDQLHSLEEAVLLGALSLDERLVISAAAWVVESPVCRTALTRRATVAWLDVPVDVAIERAANSAHRRRIGRDELAELGARRRPLFAAVADVHLDATRPVVDLVGAVLDLT